MAMLNNQRVDKSPFAIGKSQSDKKKTCFYHLQMGHGYHN